MARKVVYERSGDPAQVVRIVEDDGPQSPQRGQVLVRVTAFSVHPGDLAHLQARGIAYGDRPRRRARQDRHGHRRHQLNGLLHVLRQDQSVRLRHRTRERNHRDQLDE